MSLKRKGDIHDLEERERARRKLPPIDVAVFTWPVTKAFPQEDDRYLARLLLESMTADDAAALMSNPWVFNDFHDRHRDLWIRSMGAIALDNRHCWEHVTLGELVPARCPKDIWDPVFDACKLEVAAYLARSMFTDKILDFFGESGKNRVTRQWQASLETYHTELQRDLARFRRYIGEKLLVAAYIERNDGSQKSDRERLWTIVEVKDDHLLCQRYKTPVELHPVREPCPREGPWMCNHAEITWRGGQDLDSDAEDSDCDAYENNRLWDKTRVVEVCMPEFKTRCARSGMIQKGFKALTASGLESVKRQLGAEEDEDDDEFWAQVDAITVDEDGDVCFDCGSRPDLEAILQCVLLKESVCGQLTADVFDICKSYLLV